MGTLQRAEVGDWGQTRSGRYLQSIRRDMDLKGRLMQFRRRNEEVLSLAYQDGTMLGGGGESENLRENALNLPYRYLRWLESMATSKDAVIKAAKESGPGQVAGGPGDEETAAWVAEALKRIAIVGGLKNELKSVIGEVVPRGTSVIAIGYHQEVINLGDAREVGKDSQSVVADVLGADDLEAKPGQEHGEIASGLMGMAADPAVQSNPEILAMGGVDKLLDRAQSHLDADLKSETDDKPISSSRMIRRRIWFRKRRVSEDCGWAPHVYDTADAPMWWDRYVWTVAEVKASPLFKSKFKREVKGYDGYNVSGVAAGGEMPSTQSMGSDARQAQSETVLDDDERLVEFFVLWIRRPDMKSGGLRKIVSPECPEDFVEADDSNPYVDENGYCLIPGFFPFYDFTPIKSSLTVPERTCGIPPIAVGMTQFEKIAEYNRLRRESALRHSLRLYEMHPALKDNKRLADALRNGEDGFAYFANQGQMTADGRVMPGVTPIQFTGNSQEIERQAAREEGDWVKVMGMPPAVLQGMGTAETASQEQMGVAAGERESMSLLEYFEERTADVYEGVRGLMRGFYDDEDFIELLGEQGAAVLKAWQMQTKDTGDRITVTFGPRAEAQKTVDRKQLMEAITLEQGQVEPITGLPKYDSTHLFEELHRRLEVGSPKQNDGVIRKLQEMVLQLAQALKMATGVDVLGGGGAPAPGGGPPGGGGSSPQSGGPNPAEGDGPTQGNVNAGVLRGTLEM